MSSEKKIPKPKEQKPTDIKSIGLILKRKREEHSYTLEHVSEITRITLTCLRNIEEGNLDLLPGLVFVRGFIRNYAKLLGLDSDWMIEALNQTYNNKGPQDSSDPVESEGLDFSEENKTNKKTYVYLGTIIVAVIIAAAIYWNIQTSGNYSAITNKVETVQAVESQAIVSAEDQFPLKSIPIKKEVEAAKPIAETVISPLTLTLVSMGNEWIRLKVDENEPFEQKLEKGKKYEWPANKEYNLIMTTGDTALIHLNGEEIIDRENYRDQLYQVQLNKFTLTEINN